MNVYRVTAKDDLEDFPHTWTKGFDYEVVEKGDYFTLATDRGQVNYVNKVKDDVFSHFNKEK